MPTRLAAAAAKAEAEDPRSTMVAQASFWWCGEAFLVERGHIHTSKEDFLSVGHLLGQRLVGRAEVQT